MVALLLFNYFCDEVLRSIVRVHDVKLPINLVDLSGPLCKCKSKECEASEATNREENINDKTLALFQPIDTSLGSEDKTTGIYVWFS